MAENNNAALRAWRVLKSASEQAENVKTYEAWAEVFGVEESEPPRAVLKVAGYLSLLNDQLDEVEKRLDASEEHPPALYRTQLNRARKATNAGALAGTWSSGRSHLTDDTLNALRWGATVLPDEGREVEPELLEELENLLDELEDLIGSEDVPGELRDFLSRQVTIMRRALREYPLVGPRALSSAVSEILVEYGANQDVAEEYENEEAISLWKRAVELTVEVGAVAGALKALADVVGVAGLLSAAG